MEKKIVIIIAVAIFCSAIYTLINNWEFLWWSIRGIINATIQGEIQLNSSTSGPPWWELPITLTTLCLIIISKFIAAYGLIRFSPWARTLMVGVLFCDFLIRLGGAINMWTYRYRHPEVEELWQSLRKSVDAHHQIYVISMWPSYIMGVVSLIFIFALTRKSIKEAFVDQKNLLRKEMRV